MWVKDTDDVTYWRPESAYSLGRDNENYVPIHHVVLVVPQAAEGDAEGGWSLQPRILKDHRLTSLHVMIPGYPLRGVLFNSSQHPLGSQEILQLDFPAAMDYLRNFFETGIHLLEVIENETHITTRFIVGSWKDSCMPNLPLYTPRKPGGPLFRDIDGNYSFLETVRSYNRQHIHRLPHNIEFFVSISSKQMSHLETLCSKREDPEDQ